MIFPGVTLAPILPIIEQIGNAALSSIASDLASILSIFSSAANAINTTMPAVTMPSTCATTKSSSSTAFPTAVDPGLGSLLSSLAAVTSSSVSVPTAMLTASVAVSTPSNPSLTFSSMAPIVTSVDVSVPININPNVSMAGRDLRHQLYSHIPCSQSHNVTDLSIFQVNLAAIVAGAVNASLTSLTLLSSALVLQAEQTLALLTLLANLNMGGLAGLATLTDLSSVQSSLRTISDLDLITVVNSLLTSASPGGKRDLAFFTTGLLEDPMAFIAVIESLTGTVDDIVASASYVIMQQLGTTGLTEALEGVETGDLPPTSSLLVEL